MERFTSFLKKLKIPAILFLTVAVAVCSFKFFTPSSRAEVNETNAVPFRDVERTYNGFPNGTMIIGTYVMHRSSMTDKIMADAYESQNDSGQTSIFYKSDLAGGTWYDITSASDLTEIYDGGKVATDEELTALWLRYYVTSSGTVYDLLKKGPVNPFNIKDPYNVAAMSETQGLRDTLKGIVEGTSDTRGGPVMYARWKVNAFLGNNYHTAQTNQLDVQLGSLFNFYSDLFNAERFEEAEQLMKIMETVDAKRRLLVLTRLTRNVGAPPKFMSMDWKSEFKPLAKRIGYSIPATTKRSTDRKCASEIMYGNIAADCVSILEIQLNGIGYNDESYEKMTWESQDSLVQAVADARRMFNDTMSQYRAKGIGGGGTVLSRTYKASADAILGRGNASGLSASNIPAELTNMVDISNIMNGKSINVDREADLLRNILIPTAESISYGGFTGGAGSLYSQGVANGEKAPALKARLNQQREDELQPTVEELQQLLTEYVSRIDARSGLNFLYYRLDITDYWERRIRNDAFSSYSKAALEEHRTWLRNEIKKILDANPDLKEGASAAEEEKAAAAMQRDMALDNNDLTLAEVLGDKVAEADKKLGGQLSQQLDAVNGAQTTGARAAAEDGLGDDTMESAIAALVDKVKDQIAENAGGFSEAQFDNTDFSDLGIDGMIAPLTPAPNDGYNAPSPVVIPEPNPLWDISNDDSISDKDSWQDPPGTDLLNDDGTIDMAKVEEQGLLDEEEEEEEGGGKEIDPPMPFNPGELPSIDDLANRLYEGGDSSSGAPDRGDTGPGAGGGGQQPSTPGTGDGGQTPGTGDGGQQPEPGTGDGGQTPGEPAAPVVPGDVQPEPTVPDVPTEPVTPGVTPGEPGTTPDMPVVPGTEPTAPAEPGTEPTEPGTEPTEPGTEPTEPTAPTEPTDGGTGEEAPKEPESKAEEADKSAENDLGLSDPTTPGAEAMDALAELGAEDALEDIADMVEMAGGSEADKKAVKDSQKKAAENAGDTGAGMGSIALDERGIIEIIENYYGKPYSKIESRGKIVAAVAVAEFGRSYVPARAVGRRLMREQIDARNPYGFRKISNPDPDGQYTSLTALATAADFRYEYRNKLHYLSHRAVYYTMNIGDDIITDEKGKQKRLQGKLQKGPGLAPPGGSEDVPYLMDKDAKALLDVKVEYVDDTDYGGCFNNIMEKQKEELIKAFNEY